MGVNDWRGNPRKYKEAKDAFVEWLATPEDERSPESQRELADTLDVHYQTLTDWKYEQWCQEEVRHAIYVRLADKRAKIYHSLVQQAEKGSYKHIKLYSELMGDNVDRIDITSGGKEITESDARSMTGEEMARKIMEDKRNQLEQKGFDDSEIDRILDAFSSSQTRHQSKQIEGTAAYEETSSDRTDSNSPNDYKGEHSNEPTSEQDSEDRVE